MLRLFNRPEIQVFLSQNKGVYEKQMANFLFNNEKPETSQLKNRTCMSQSSISRKKQYKIHILVRKIHDYIHRFLKPST